MNGMIALNTILDTLKYDTRISAGDQIHIAAQSTAVEINCFENTKAKQTCPMSIS